MTNQQLRQLRKKCIESFRFLNITHRIFTHSYVIIRLLSLDYLVNFKDN